MKPHSKTSMHINIKVHVELLKIHFFFKTTSERHNIFTVDDVCIRLNICELKNLNIKFLGTAIKWQATVVVCTYMESPNEGEGERYAKCDNLYTREWVLMKWGKT